MGLGLNEKNELVRMRPAVLDIDLVQFASDYEQLPDFDTDNVRTLGDLGPVFQVRNVAGIAVQRAEVVREGVLRLTVNLPGEDRLSRLARVFTPDIVRAIAYVPDEDGQGSKKDFNPPNASWGDFGDFFKEAAEFFDPIQGQVANCYYIAALSAVAWARPLAIRHLTRATGVAQAQFTNMVRFYDIDNGNAVREIEVTDTIPLANSTGNPIYCRSSEAGEIWPAVYEKAFAKWKTGYAGDQPDITATAWGDCVHAAAELTGLGRHYYATTDLSAGDLWQKVRQNSQGGRTFNPMVAATYSSGKATEKKLVYGDINLVASHCYAVLGWAYRENKKYIILRNPWGSTEASTNVLSGTVFLYDVSWWRPITLANSDGTFALEAGAFKQYFSTLGVVK